MTLPKLLIDSVADLEATIIAAALKIGGGRTRTRVELADLRDALRSVSRSTLDSTLIDMQKRGKLVLYHKDANLTSRDTLAAMSVGGNSRHILYLM